MPELPEVETIRRQLDPLLRNCTIVEAWAFESPKFTQAHDAVGWRLDGVRRRGKYLLMNLDSPTGKRELIVHLGMTGRLSVSSNLLGQDTLDHQNNLHARNSLHAKNISAASPQNSWAESAAVDPADSSSLRHLRAVWTLDDGRCLYFDDVRRFGRIAVVAAADYHSLATLAALGPEPFDVSFTPEYLRAQINSSKRCIKTQLLAQRVVAGLGNIYVDEALWRSQVHPAAKRLTVMQSKKLRDDICDVLSAAINNGGTTLRNYRDAAGASGSNQRYLDCYGRAGQDCLRCGSTLRRIVIDARATVYCPSCQKR
ncbi:DNA-(apurinic or apyrimidinic site) lyase [Actinobacteria bacterium IMCC26207]|nr:DNA-(apurinic or apyrimidinic site) lyase [Actinobacteria bacterium IMCC26207]